MSNYTGGWGTTKLPDYNEIFITGNPPVIMKRVGDGLIGLSIEGLGEQKFKPSTQYPSVHYVPASTRFNWGKEVLKEAGIDLDTIPGMSAGQFADVQAIMVGMGGPIRKASIEEIRPQKVTSAPNIEIKPSLVNPYGSDTYAD